MPRLRHSLALATLAALGVGALAARPAAAQTVDFATLAGSNGSAFTTYAQNGFTVANAAGQFFVGQSYGNPVPDLFAGPFFGPATNALSLTRTGGGTFSFSQFDLSPNNGATNYTLVGTLGGAPVFNIGGVDNTGGFSTITAGTAGFVVDAVTLSLTISGSSANVDNLVFSTPTTATPEPATWALFGAGLLALGGVARRSRQTRA